MAKKRKSAFDKISLNKVNKENTENTENTENKVVVYSVETKDGIRLLCDWDDLITKSEKEAAGLIYNRFAQITPADKLYFLGHKSDEVKEAAFFALKRALTDKLLTEANDSKWRANLYKGALKSISNSEVDELVLSFIWVCVYGFYTDEEWQHVPIEPFFAVIFSRNWDLPEGVYDWFAERIDGVSIGLLEIMQDTFAQPAYQGACTPESLVFLNKEIARRQQGTLNERHADVAKRPVELNAL